MGTTKKASKPVFQVFLFDGNGTRLLISFFFSFCGGHSPALTLRSTERSCLARASYGVFRVNGDVTIYFLAEAHEVTRFCRLENIATRVSVLFECFVKGRLVRPLNELEMGKKNTK